MPSQPVLTRSELSELALDAAIELDKARPQDGAKFPNLEKFLVQMKGQLHAGAGLQTLRDETMYPFFSYALTQASDSEIHDRGSFLHSMNAMIEKHNVDVGKLHELDNLKKFCVAFHESIISNTISAQISASRHDNSIR
jgi:hypothetical protein